MSMSFKNVGVDATTETTQIAITCDDDRVEILDGEAEMGILLAGEVAEIQNAFRIIIDEGVEDGTKFQLDVEMTCGRQTWGGKAIITAGQAILQYVDTTLEGSFVPGETTQLVAKVKNIGHYMATNATATLSTTSHYVTIPNETVEIGTLDPEGIASCVFNIDIDASCPETEAIVINYVFEAEGGIMAEGSITLKNSLSYCRVNSFSITRCLFIILVTIHLI